MNPHSQRWITGLGIVPILFAAIAWGSEALFAGLIAVATLLGIAEYNRMFLGKDRSRERYLTLAGGLLILGAAFIGQGLLIVAVLTFCVMTVLMLNLLPDGNQGPDMACVGKVLLGILYIPLLMSHFILLRQSDGGQRWVFLVLIVAFVGDIAAFYVGKGLGRRKLLPLISPGKTVEGTLGLFAGSTSGAVLFACLFLPALPWWHAALMGLVGGVAGQLGDLAESAMKRSAGLKDSGALLPGHGGILDRLDCLMFIAPFIYYYRVSILS